MIVVLEEHGAKVLFANVTHIEEKTKPSVLGGDRKVINIYSGETALAGGDDIDLSLVHITILPNAEKE